MKNTHKPITKGKHSINLYVDFDKEIAGCFITGHYDVQRTMLLNAALENNDFGSALIEAAVDYIDIINEKDSQ